MATLSAAAIVKIRQIIGDSNPDTATGFDLTDTEIQEEWDNADGDSADEARYLAYYYLLERRYGIWMNSVDTETQEGSRLQSQKLKQIERAMERYRKLSGLGEFVIPSRAGVLDFDTIENESTS